MTIIRNITESVDVEFGSLGWVTHKSFTHTSFNICRSRFAFASKREKQIVALLSSQISRECRESNCRELLLERILGTCAILFTEVVAEGVGSHVKLKRNVYVARNTVVAEVGG